MILSALRYRPGQAVALFVVALLGVAACAFGPFYARAVEQAQLRSTLAAAPLTSSGLSVRAGAGPLDALLPSGSMARMFDAPVMSTQLSLSYQKSEHEPYLGSIVHRDSQCAYLRFVAGACPATTGGIAVSQPLAARMHWTVGSRIEITTAGYTQWVPRPPIPLTVVAVYAPFESDDAYWFGHPYSTPTGITEIGDPNSLSNPGSDVMDAFFARASFPDDLAAQLPTEGKSSVQHSADLPLRVDQVGLDDLPALPHGLAGLKAAGSAQPGSVVQTQLPSLLAEVDTGRHQARTVIPAFAAELALLVLVVVGMVVVSAADQRGQQVALARLRGRSTGRAARIVGDELSLVVAAGVLPGLGLAWLLCWLGCRTWLGDRAAPEWRWPVFAAAAALAAVEVLIVAAVAWRLARRPVHELLRRVPRRASRRGLGAVEGAVGAAAIAGAVVMLSGARTNALAVITPGLIALVVGFALSRVVGAVGARWGRRAMWRGRLAVGLAGLQVARRPGTRRVVVLVCVATALVVSAADQWAVSGRNRAARADVQAGAPVLLTVHADTAAALQQAVSAADPSGAYATPVIRQVPLQAAPVFAVDPAAFGRIAGWGWPANKPTADQLAKLRPHRPGPITFTGSQVRLDLADVSLKRSRPPEAVGGTRGPVFLTLNLFRTGGEAVDVRVGPLPEGTGHTASLTANVPCGQGCSLSQLALLRTTTDTDIVTVDAVITGLSAGTPGALRTVPLGAAADWAATAPDQATSSGAMQTIGLRQAGGGLHLRIVNSTAQAVLQHLDRPVAIPALTAGATGLSADADGNLTDDNIDGLTASFTPVGTVPLVPGAGGPALLIDLQTAALVASPGLSGSTTEIWLASDNPARERAFVAALASHGVEVADRDSAAAHRDALAATAPAWAMQLALATAALAVLLAALVAVLTAATTRRSRAYDASALSLVGVQRSALRRATRAEQAAAVIAAVVVGAVIGWFGARLALPSVPMFLTTAEQPAVLHPTAWGSVLLAAAVALVVLVCTAFAVASGLLRRIAPARLREGQQ